MPSVPRSRAAGQMPARTLDITNPRSVFVWITEAREAFDDLVTVAADATRPPGRRQLSRRAALARYRRGRAALEWLFSMRLDAPRVPESPAPTGEPPRFESFAE